MTMASDGVPASLAAVWCFAHALAWKNAAAETMALVASQVASERL